MFRNIFWAKALVSGLQKSINDVHFILENYSSFWSNNALLYWIIYLVDRYYLTNSM